MKSLSDKIKAGQWWTMPWNPATGCTPISKGCALDGRVWNGAPDPMAAILKSHLEG